MRVLAPWRQRAAVAPGGAAAEEGQPLEVARKSAAAGAVDPGEAAQPLEVARKSGRSGDLIEEAMGDQDRAVQPGDARSPDGQIPNHLVRPRAKPRQARKS